MNLPDNSGIAVAEYQLRKAYTNYKYTKEQSEQGNIMARILISKYTSRYIATREKYKAVKEAIDSGKTVTYTNDKFIII